MDAKPRSKLGIVIFCLVFLAVAGAITATVLFANDRRNLNIVLRSLGVEVHETMVIPKPGTMERFKGKRLKDVALMLDSYVFMAEITGVSSVFLRDMRKDGEKLCGTIGKLGYKMSEWAPGSFTRKVRECFVEETIANPDKPDDPSTFFLMIKGAEDGTLISARVKFIFTDAPAREKLTGMAAEVLTELSRVTGWGEFAWEAGKIRGLVPFTSSLAGVSVKFSSEFSGAGRYNLIMARAAPFTRGQRRTENYFNRTNFMPLRPEHGGPPVTVQNART